MFLPAYKGHLMWTVQRRFYVKIASHGKCTGTNCMKTWLNAASHCNRTEPVALDRSGYHESHSAELLSLSASAASMMHMKVQVFTADAVLGR